MSTENTAQEGDIVQLVGVKHKHHILKLQAGRKIQTHRGEIKHEDLIGLPWGSEVLSHINKKFYLIQPSVADLIQNIPRRTQILYPKDIGFILIQMGIGPGSRVGEAGSGSGAMSTAIAHAVGDSGHLYSYDNKPDCTTLAAKNLRQFGLDSRATFYQQDIEEGIKETDLDAFFLDVRNSYDFIPQVKSSLKTGGHLGIIAPTMNQVVSLLKELEANTFAFVEVVEILLRYYRTRHFRLRPVDRMVAHTGYLVFARAMTKPVEEDFVK
jgi:tRNA (adenine57-N1/adenine58-N1)-methyltransferase